MAEALPVVVTSWLFWKCIAIIWGAGILPHIFIFAIRQIETNSKAFESYFDSDRYVNVEEMRSKKYREFIWDRMNTLEIIASACFWPIVHLCSFIVFCFDYCKEMYCNWAERNFLKKDS